MTEHEQLKQICDKIGYNIFPNKIKYSYPEFKFPGEFFKKYTSENEVNVREIIFTQEFMNKFGEYYSTKKYKGFDILNNLNNPIQYLYNLLGLGKQ